MDFVFEQAQFVIIKFFFFVVFFLKKKRNKINVSMKQNTLNYMRIEHELMNQASDRKDKKKSRKRY